MSRLWLAYRTLQNRDNVLIFTAGARNYTITDDNMTPPPYTVRPVDAAHDGTNIQNALDQAHAAGAGSVVGLFPGDWQLDRTLTKHASTHLFGYGRGHRGTNITAIDGLDAEMLIITGGTNPITDTGELVRGSTFGIRWDGNRANQTITNPAVKLINCAWYQFLDCAIANVKGQPMRVVAAFGSLIQDEGEVSRCLFEDCDDGVTFAYESGSVAAPGDWRFTSCQFDRLDGAAVSGSFSNLNQFDACQFLSCTRGPHATNGYGWSFNGCFSRNHQEENWLFTNHTGAQITGGHSHLGSRVGVNAHSGIKFINSPDFQVTGVKSHDFFFGFAPINQKYGIEIDVNSIGGQITGSDVRAAYNSTGNILDSSGTVVTSGNKL